MGLRIVQLVAVLLTALALVPGGAHLFALPNKIALPQAAYFTAQGIYRGWALLGLVVIGALVADLALAIALRGQRTARALAATAAALIAASLAIFFVWTFPANQATANWTTAPANWATLRLHWEYTHAASAALTFAALVCVTLAVIVARR
jgi:hypothetical protein